MPLAQRSVLLLLALTLASCATQRESRLADNAAALPPPDPVTFAQSDTKEMQIGPQDRLSVTVYPVREYSVPSARVAADGSVLVPPLGTLRAQGKTPSALADEIKAALTQCCLRNPMVVVQVEETLSRQIVVTGAVKSANVYNLRGRTTLLQAINMAGGADPTLADTRRVGIIRTVNGQRMGKIFNVSDIQAGRAEDPEVYGGDQIIVDTSDTKSAWRTVLQALPVTSIFAIF